VRRIKVRSKQDRSVRSQLGKLERRLNKSQKQTCPLFFGKCSRP
jgi:hypothetical protein